MTTKTKKRSARNRTLVLTDIDRERLQGSLKRLNSFLKAGGAPSGVGLGDFKSWLQHIPKSSIDLLFLDPPYNLNKAFNGLKFKRRSVAEYTKWLSEVIAHLVPYLKADSTIYICGDWRTSHSIFEVASEHFTVRNRITWEREKGRGSRTNWKNSSEDIWFCTMSKNYHFDVDSVKLRRRVVAPYTQKDGSPKDWQRTDIGNYRDTHPSNLWSDITIPFWSMPENTDHPTQKSEKLLARLIMASSRPNDFVFDPFLGSGTTAVVASKLGRRFFGVDIDEEYCLWALSRLERSQEVTAIQGYADGVFWERNTGPAQKRADKL